MHNLDRTFAVVSYPVTLHYYMAKKTCFHVEIKDNSTQYGEKVRSRKRLQERSDLER